MKSGARVRVIPGPPHHPYTGVKVGEQGRIVSRESRTGKQIVWVLMKGDDEPQEWWVEYLEVIR